MSHCGTISPTGPALLDSAVIAEEFLSLFPLPSEAVLNRCSQLLRNLLTSPEDLLRFAVEQAQDPARGMAALRLLARFEKTFPLPTSPSTAVTTATTITEKSKESKSNGSSMTCLNCQQSPCLHGQQVRDPSKIVVGCKLLSFQGAYFKGATCRPATVVQLLPKEVKPLRVRWEGVKGQGPGPGSEEGMQSVKCYPIPHGQQMALFTFYCNVETSSTCNNCKQSPCLDTQGLQDLQKVVVPCQLLSVQGAWGPVGVHTSQQATVVQLLPDDPRPLLVIWGPVQGEGKGIQMEGFSKNYPLPKSGNKPIFTYSCIQTNGDKTSNSKKYSNFASTVATKASSCPNCQYFPCLNREPVGSFHKVVVGCKLLTIKDGYYGDKQPSFATVVEVMPDTPKPLRVRFEGLQSRGVGRIENGRIKNCPKFAFQYCCQDE